MALKTNGAGSCDASPTVFVSDEGPSNSKKRSETQQIRGSGDSREALALSGYFEQVVTVGGDLGPIHLLGSPAPRVNVAARGGSTFVWVCNAPWGKDTGSREFLKAPSAAANRYALELAAKLRDMALVEAERVERVKSARLAELTERRK